MRHHLATAAPTPHRGECDQPRASVRRNVALHPSRGPIRRAAVPLILATLCASPLASAAPPPEGQVVAVRRGQVYVDLGRRHGVRAGDVLSGPGQARLEVVQLGERQLVAEPRHGAPVRVGATVTAPVAPAEASDRRPVVTLPPPQAGPSWTTAAAPPRRLVPTPARPGAPGRRAPSDVEGELVLTYAGMLDEGAHDLDLHQAELRSKLAVKGLAGGHVDYRHDLSARAELGPDLDARHGADSRPIYRIRALALRYASDPDPSSAPALGQRPAGAFEATLGRLQLPESPSTGLLDGVRAELALGRGFSAGLHGGLAPDLLDTGLSADVAVLGAHASWATADPASPLRARATATTAASLFRGALNRLDLGLQGGLSWGRDLDLYGAAVGTLVDDTLLPDAQSAATLSRAFLGARVRPLRALTIDAHFAHDRFVLDREWLARLGPDYAWTGARESASLQVRLDPLPLLSLALSGYAGFGSDAAEHAGGAGRVTLRGLAIDASRLAFGYRLSQTPAVLAQVADLDLGIPIGDLLEIGLSYQFATFHARALDERQDEHRVEAGVDLLAPGPWRVSARAAYAFGHLPGQLALTALFGWRFP